MKYATEKIDLNTVDVDELVELGLPSPKARRIVEYRQLRGYFRSVDDVLKVRGIGQVMFSKLESKVRVTLPEPTAHFAGMSRAEKALLGMECCETRKCVSCPYFEWAKDRKYNETEYACITRNKTDVKNLLAEMCGHE